MRRFFILLIICLFFFTGCKEKTSYGTSMSIINELTETLSVILYPKEKPFEFQTEFLINSNSNHTLYWTSDTGIDILYLIANVFDSILISEQSGKFRIKFSPDTATNCTFNPYKDISIWESEIIKGDDADDFKRNLIEIEYFYFRIKDENIIK